MGKPNTKMGAPGLDFEAWESTNSNISASKRISCAS
jgi:hypothetical protein